MCRTAAEAGLIVLGRSQVNMVHTHFSDVAEVRILAPEPLVIGIVVGVGTSITLKGACCGAGTLPVTSGPRAAMTIGRETDLRLHLFGLIESQGNSKVLFALS